MRAAAILAAMVACQAARADSLFTPASPLARLFCDRKAYRVGDVLTVIIAETAQGSHQAARKLAKQTDTKLGPGTGVIDMVPAAGFGGKSKIDASGTSTRTGTLRGRLTVIVTAVTPTGTLVVEGTRTVRVNKDTQTFRLRGEVRARDIRPDNTILSQSLANATIEYEGTDPRKTGSRGGLIEQILNFFF